MLIVHKHGKTPSYNYDKDPKITRIMEGPHGLKEKEDSKHAAIAIDGLMTIWLLILPEKFQEWYAFHNFPNYGFEKTTVMKMNERPSFPMFATKKVKTNIHPHLATRNYKFLPTSWNLTNCFEYFLEQKQLWTTRSIEAECTPKDDTDFEKKVSATESELFGSSSEDEEEEVKKPKDENEGVQEAQVIDEATAVATMKLESADDWEEIKTPIPRKRKSTANSPSSNKSSSGRKQQKTEPPEEPIIYYQPSKLLSNLDSVLHDIEIKSTMLLAADPTPIQLSYIEGIKHAIDKTKIHQKTA